MLLLALLLANVTYHGGDVLPAPRYYNLYWGNYWWQHQDDTSWFESFTRTVAPSWQLASQVTEYSINGQEIGGGSFGGGFVVKDDPAATITDSDIVEFIEKQIENKVVPSPDEHAVYTVFLAPGVKISDEDSNVLAYHGPTRYGFREIMVHFDSYVLDAASREVAAVAYSHEMAETMTDPDLDGWYDDSRGLMGEVGDLCGGHVAEIGGYMVQQEWSNAANGCVASRSVPLPPGDGGRCPDGTSLQNGECQGNLIGWGCSSEKAGVSALFALITALAATRARGRGRGRTARPATRSSARA